MNISYRNLQAFIHVAQSSTFAEAAIKLHLTQPALSSAIKKMEEQLGGKLFSRSTRHVALTKEGEALLPNAIRIMRDWDDTFGDIQNLFAMAKGRLTIAAMPSFAESHLPHLLKRYHQLAPNINLRILDVVMENVIYEVSEGRAEMGFTFEPQQNEGLIFTPLFEDCFVVVVNPQHELAKAKTVSWEACIEHPMVMMNRGSAVRMWTQQKISTVGDAVIVAETGQLGTLGQLIKQGLGIAIMPSLCIASMESIGLTVLNMKDDPLVKRVGMVKNAKRDMSVAGQALWTEVLHHYQR
ncbi:MAG: LysR family transcriptional regulator [Alteromonas stellipolaris]|jgi:LysR family carnitine catabolism transcriptional activator|uniref:LysR family transcriptional regulator n=1 Tax=Alteromonas stellipolaris TaxID=233316 RepID=UPI002734DBA8|nr:LysR family transcriptional regulator [Alteromonas stellipolaris]MDP2534848.1 LysR family transcriptional regulator [Alteromonas stellipolaris]